MAIIFQKLMKDTIPLIYEALWTPSRKLPKNITAKYVHHSKTDASQSQKAITGKKTHPHPERSDNLASHSSKDITEVFRVLTDACPPSQRKTRAVPQPAGEVTVGNAEWQEGTFRKGKKKQHDS